MMLETMSGELVNARYLRNIYIVSGTTDDGDTAYAIHGRYAANAVSELFRPLDEPTGELLEIQLGSYKSEQDARDDLHYLKNAITADRGLFMFGKVYE